MFCFAAFKNGNRTSLSLFVFLKTEFALPFYDLLNVDKRSSLDVEHHPVTLRRPGNHGYVLAGITNKMAAFWTLYSWRSRTDTLT